MPFIACGVFYLILRNIALTRAGVPQDIMSGLLSRMIDNVFIIPRYLLNIIWPYFLSPKYYVPDDFHVHTLPLIFGWGGVLIIMLWGLTGTYRKYTFYGLAWLIVFWLPVSGIFPIPSAPLADRYMYLPLVGIWLLLAYLLDCACTRLGGRWKAGTLVVITLLLGMTSHSYSQFWKNDVELFTRLVKLYPDKAYGYHNLGCAYLDKEKNLELAEKSFEHALLLDPLFPRLRTQLGYVRLLKGDYEGALSHYNHAVYQNPLDAEAWLNRGEVLERTGRVQEALESYRRFLATPAFDLLDARSRVKNKLDKLTQSAGR